MRSGTAASNLVGHLMQIVCSHFLRVSFTLPEHVIPTVIAAFKNNQLSARHDLFVYIIGCPQGSVSDLPLPVQLFPLQGNAAAYARVWIKYPIACLPCI